MLVAIKNSQNQIKELHLPTDYKKIKDSVGIDGIVEIIYLSEEGLDELQRFIGRRIDLYELNYLAEQLQYKDDSYQKINAIMYAEDINTVKDLINAYCVINKKYIF